MYKDSVYAELLHFWKALLCMSGSYFTGLLESLD